MSLKHIRENKGLSQTEVANYLNISRQGYNHYETGKREPSKDTYLMLANLFGVSLEVLMYDDINFKPCSTSGVMIPVLGNVQAGIPITAVEEVLDYEEISESLSRTGEFFALSIKGDSMLPRIRHGDVAIVKKQSFAESGDLVVVLINGYDATIKKLAQDIDGIMLIPLNTDFEVQKYTNKDIEEMPVNVIGKVVEVRCKY